MFFRLSRLLIELILEDAVIFAENKLTVSCQQAKHAPLSIDCTKQICYVIHFSNLYRNLDEFVEFITSQEPPEHLINNFPNPYTGHTIPAVVQVDSLEAHPELQETASVSASREQEPIQETIPPTKVELKTAAGISKRLKNWIINFIKIFFPH